MKWNIDMYHLGLTLASTIPHLWIQPTMHLCSTAVLTIEKKNSLYKWTCIVQTHVVKGATVFLSYTFPSPTQLPPQIMPQQ